ncbi:MAG TPA: PqqD family peptide modification chaperone [Phycisphaerales bacterium]|nr:PqqD family peptide modification chaperone [Phycisphaerales bacterium]
MSERSTFSPFWHRVRVMKPRLRPHVQITRQHYRGQRWHVVHDPSSNQYYRLNPVAHEFVGLLDGHREVEAVWQASLQKHGDAALTQNEVIQLLSQLFSSNLLSADVPPETEQLLSRGRQRLGQKVKQQAIGLMYFRIKLFNPDRILTWLEPIFRPLIGRVGFILWAMLVIIALGNLLPYWDELRGGFESAIAPANWGWIMVVFVVTKLWHELGHGLICKRYGGQVPEFGAMMLVLIPAPYVDASAAWGFGSKWQRMAVGAGGMIFELTMASIAAFVWIATRHTPGMVHQLAYNVMFTAGISTVLFNANPLMKFDGYYILSDLLEVPNLMQRSQNMLKFLAQRFIYQIKGATPPTSSPGEAMILLTYGVLAMVYRVFLFFSITLYVMGQMFAIGLFLALWTAAVWFIAPVGGFVHWLATNTQLNEFRGRAIATSFVLIVAGLLLVGVIPMPDRRRAVGVVESEHRSGVYFRTAGFVIESKKRPGDFVKQGEPLVVLESDELEAVIERTRGEIAGAKVKEGVAHTKDIAASKTAQDYIVTLNEKLTYLLDKKDKLTVRAPHDGVLVGQDPENLVGSYVNEGDGLCEIVDLGSVRVVATLTQPEAAWLYELNSKDYEVEVRRLSEVDRVYDARTDKVLAGGTRELPHQSLGFQGGGTIEVDERDRSGLTAARPLFTAYFTPLLEEGAFAGQPGERVALRFELPSKPLVSQWVDRLEKLIQGRVKL